MVARKKVSHGTISIALLCMLVLWMSVHYCV